MKVYQNIISSIIIAVAIIVGSIIIADAIEAFEDDIVATIHATH